jgi:hypothetical protein
MCHAAWRVGALIRVAVLTLVVLCIGSCGGGGGGGGGSSGSNLFVADSGTHAIGSVVNANPAPGNINVDRIITGTSSNGIIGTIPALLLDVGRDQLYVSNETTIVVFNHASTANGPVNYDRRVAMLVPPGGNFNSMSLDAARDELYVGDLSNGVRVYHNASTANETTTPNLPARTISFTNVGVTLYVRDIALDTVHDVLYVAVDTQSAFPASMSILAFDGASGLPDGPAIPDRIIAITTNTFTTMGLFVDSAHDRLYFADSGGDVSIFESASTKNGSVAPDKSIILPSTVLRLTVDTVHDRLYAAGSSAVYMVPNISTVPPGPVTATAAVAAPGSVLTAVAVRP